MDTETRMVPEPGKRATAIAGLNLVRWDEAGQRDVCFYASSVGVILQGHKESRIGSDILRYGALDCLVNGVNMPSQSVMLEASAQKPLLAVSRIIERSLAAEVATCISPEYVVPQCRQCYLGVSVISMSPTQYHKHLRLYEANG